MSDLHDIEQELPSQLRELAGTISSARLTRAGIDRRVAQRANRRRTRRAIGSGAVAAVALFVGVGALRLQDRDTGARVISGGGVIASAAQPVGPVGTPNSDPPDRASPPATLSTVVPVPVDASPASKPVGAQNPDPAKNLPAAPEPAFNAGITGQDSSIAPASGGTARGSSSIPAPAGAQEVPPPSGQLDPQPAEGLVAQDPAHRQLCEKPDGSVTVIIGRPANPSSPPASPPAAAGCKGGQ